MAKIATHAIAQGDGWTVDDVVCSSGPHDRPFEEQHHDVAIAIVTAGTFQYRGSGGGKGREMMTPGSLLLGNPGQYFECGHEHAEYFETITAGAGNRRSRRGFAQLRLPPMRSLSPIIAQACAALERSDRVSWEELSVRIAIQAVAVDRGGAPSRAPIPASGIARVTRTVRMIENRLTDEVTIADLAREAGLSPFHFLRVFEDLTGVTPHQYLMRARLRRAAARVTLESSKILDIALDSGFGDVSNFNRAFRAEFGTNPRSYRRANEVPPAR